MNFFQHYQERAKEKENLEIQQGRDPKRKKKVDPERLEHLDADYQRASEMERGVDIFGAPIDGGGGQNE